MNRRELLRVGGSAFGASALAASISGCLSGPLVGHPEVREESGQTVERTIHTPLTDESADPAFATLVVGDRGGFHLGEKKPVQVWVRNGTDERREVGVELAANADADPWFARLYDFDSGAQLVIELRTPGEYAVTVRDGDRAEAVEVASVETVGVPESWFDCNDSAMEAVVREGEIETTGITTDEGCSSF